MVCCVVALISCVSYSWARYSDMHYFYFRPLKISYFYSEKKTPKKRRIVMANVLVSMLFYYLFFLARLFGDGGGVV